MEKGLILTYFMWQPLDTHSLWFISGYIVAWCVLGLVTTTGSQFMKGSSPVVPSNILETCQQQAVAKRYNVNRDGQHSDVVNKWCS